MNIMTNAKKRAMIDTEEKYVFNEIYFGAEGMTSTSAQHVSAMANVMVNDIKERLNGLRLYQKSIRVIGEQETVTEVVNNTLPEIAEGVKTIAKANALIAWLREAVKERQAGMDDITNMNLDAWMEMMGKELPEQPKAPTSPRINFQDYQTILDTGLSVKEYNRFMELASTLAVYGEMIHEQGLLTRHKKELHRIMQNPTEVKESGRDTIITTYKIDVNVHSDLDRLYIQLQSEYRKLQAEKNGIEAKFSNLAAEYQQRKLDEYKTASAQYNEDMKQWQMERKAMELQMAEWKKAQLDRLAALKIIIPNDLKPLFQELSDKYL